MKKVERFEIKAARTLRKNRATTPKNYKAGQFSIKTAYDPKLVSTIKSNFGGLEKDLKPIFHRHDKTWGFSMESLQDVLDMLDDLGYEYDLDAAIFIAEYINTSDGFEPPENWIELQNAYNNQLLSF